MLISPRLDLLLHERAFPGAGAGRCIDDDRLRRLEDGLDAGQHLEAERLELRPAVIDHRHLHSLQDAVRNGRWTGDLEEVATGAARGIGHGTGSPDQGPHASAKPRSQSSKNAVHPRLGSFAAAHARLLAPAH